MKLIIYFMKSSCGFISILNDDMGPGLWQKKGNTNVLQVSFCKKCKIQYSVNRPFAVTCEKAKSEFWLCRSFSLSCQVLQTWEYCEKCWRESYFPFPFHFQLHMTVTRYPEINHTGCSNERSNEVGATALTFMWIL